MWLLLMKQTSLLAWYLHMVYGTLHRAVNVWDQPAEMFKPIIPEAAWSGESGDLQFFGRRLRARCLMACFISPAR